MRRFIANAFALFALLCACAPQGPTVPSYCTNEAAFTAVLAKCVDDSKTREESRACRKSAHERCGITETVSVRVTHEP